MIPTVGDKVVISMVSGRQYNGEIVEADAVQIGIKQFWSGDVVYVARRWIESQEKTGVMANEQLVREAREVVRQSRELAARIRRERREADERLKPALKRLRKIIG